MAFGDAIGAPPGDGVGLLGDFQRGIMIARAMEDVGEIGQHPPLIVNPHLGAATEIDRRTQISRPRREVTGGGLGEAGTCHGPDPQIRHRRLLGQIGDFRGMQMSHRGSPVPHAISTHD